MEKVDATGRNSGSQLLKVNTEAKGSRFEALVESWFPSTRSRPRLIIVISLGDNEKRYGRSAAKSHR